MKIGILATFAAMMVAVSSAFGAAPDAELQKKFQETLAASRLPLQVHPKSLKGPGAAFLLKQAGSSDFVLVGEEHGVASIADIVRLLMVDMAPLGYQTLAIETDPYIAAKLEGLLRKGGVKAVSAFLAGEEARFSIPFYSWSAEAQLADSVVARAPAGKPALWGLDQVFIGATGLLLRDIARETLNEDARAAAEALANRARGNLQFLGEIDPQELESLRLKLAQGGEERLAKLVADMILSGRIYAPFVGKEGLSVYQANLQREQLMKRTFLEQYERHGRPKVAFKFGANHLVRGLSPTHVPSLSSFVHEHAVAQGKQAFSVLMLCGPGTLAGGFQGDTSACEIDLAKELPEIIPHLDAKNPTVFDLSTWKDRPKRWEHLNETLRSLIWGYDAIMVVPNGKPAQMLTQGTK